MVEKYSTWDKKEKPRITKDANWRRTCECKRVRVKCSISVRRKMGGKVVVGEFQEEGQRTLGTITTTHDLDDGVRCHVRWQ